MRRIKSTKKKEITITRPNNSTLINAITNSQNPKTEQFRTGQTKTITIPRTNSNSQFLDKHSHLITASSSSSQQQRQGLQNSVTLIHPLNNIQTGVTNALETSFDDVDAMLTNNNNKDISNKKTPKTKSSRKKYKPFDATEKKIPKHPSSATNATNINTANNNATNFVTDKKGKRRILIKDQIAGSTKPVKVKNFHVRNPHDSISVGVLISLITPVRTIAGIASARPPVLIDATTGGGKNETKTDSPLKESGQESDPIDSSPSSAQLLNESLFTLRVARFDVVSETNRTTTTTGKHDLNLTSRRQTQQNQHHRGTTLSPSSSPTKRPGSAPSPSSGFGLVPSKQTIRKNINPKMKNKLRYVCIVRSTNRPLVKTKRGLVSIKGEMRDILESSGGRLGRKFGAAVMAAGGRSANSDVVDDDRNNDNVDDNGDDEENSAGDVDSSDGYDSLYNPESGAGSSSNKKKERKKVSGGRSSVATAGNRATSKHERDTKNSDSDVDPNTPNQVPIQDNDEEELSSFPMLVCLALQSDGTNPDVRKILDMEKLVSIESAPDNTGVLQLVFQAGEVIEIDCDLVDDAVEHAPPLATTGGSSNAGVLNSTTPTASSGSLRKERFLWSLLQIHAILCTSVVERNVSHLTAVARDGLGTPATTGAVAVGRTAIEHNHNSRNLTSTIDATAIGTTTMTSLPQLTMRNVDRAELQYVSTINGFLSNSPVLCALLERQRNYGLEKSKREQQDVKMSAAQEEKDNGATGGVMDGLAYDMIMGNFTRLTLFLTEEEKLDAEEVLNSTSWQVKRGAGDRGVITDHEEKMDEISTAETLATLLQKRKRDLETSSCHRLIAWEDEKYYAATGTSPRRRDSMEALSLVTLFETLDGLDQELDLMEDWLEDKARAIKPLTDDCKSVEEENMQLEQQRKSYELLGMELQRFLNGLEVPMGMAEILKDPKVKMKYSEEDGTIDVVGSESGVEDIYTAGRALKETFDRLQEEGGVHLRMVHKRVEGLTDLTNSFCQSLAEIVLQIMKKTLKEVVDDVDFTKEIQNSAHSAIAKSIRDTQRKFQSSLLSYIKLIEVLALLKPSILASVRASYSDFVCEGVLSKKRMKAYFASLPGKSTVTMSSVTIDLKDYSPARMGTGGVQNMEMKVVQAKDVQAALLELLPVIAREAYFTAALFGLSSRHLGSREKKRNFESARKSVDHSSQHFKYYISRICGIASEDAEGKKVRGDPMLSLVSSIILNDSMTGYIDRQKKGGDHSLSLAYVRATIIDLRKKVDKQWVAWIEEQIKWVNLHMGVPLNGKRAGIIPSFSRFPSYLDHVLVCCKEASITHTPTLAKIKVIAYYLQKLAMALLKSVQKCSERETTDQQYAANVMRMENSYFFTQSIKQRGVDFTELFSKPILSASAMCKQSTDAYLGWMIKREFKPLYSLFSNISRIRRDVGDADVPIHVSRSTFERTLSKECNRDVLRDKIGVIFSRMEKHLSIASGLLPVAWKALVKVLYEWFGRWEKMSTLCYKLTLEPSAVDVVRIAKQAAGITAKKKSNDNNGLNNEGGQSSKSLFGATATEFDD